MLAITVDTPLDVINSSDSVTSLREAIATANDNGNGADTIDFDPAVFTGGAVSLIRLTEGELEITDTLTIDGSMAAGVTITGDAAGDDVVGANFVTDVAASFGGVAGAADDRLDDNSRVLNFTAESGDLTLRGLTLTGGRAAGSSATGNDGGGVLFNSSGTLTLANSTVSGNTSTRDGGGISAGVGAITLTSSTVSENTTAENGGGISTVSGSVTLTSSTVSGNTSALGGGGISTESGSVTLTVSTVSGNTSEESGGGIRTGILTAVTLTSSTISGNVTAGPGGGFYNAFDQTLGTFTVDNSIIAGNEDDGTAPDLLPKRPAFALTINDSLVGDTSGSGIGGTTGTGNLLNVDPLLAPLANNGGPTKTHALLSGSPAIDAGSSTLFFDQRGLPFARSFDDPTAPGSGPDIGAYERQTVAGLPTLEVTTLADENDGVSLFGGELSLREAIGLANGSLGPDTITFAAGLGGTIDLVGELPTVTDELVIAGPGADLLRIDANHQSRHLEVARAGTLSLSGVHLTRGDAGAGLSGGAISNLGELVLEEVAVTDSVAGNRGGGVYSSGPFGSSLHQLTITGSTITGNTAAQGGGVFTRYGTATVESTTISGNTATDRSGGVSLFGGFGGLSIDQSTITGNTATNSGAGVDKRSYSGTLAINNTILSGNALAGGAANDLQGGGNLSGQYNVLGSAATGFGSDNISTDTPRLGQLRDNGGPTPTHALRPGSPAIGAGDPLVAFDANDFDQRGDGFARVFGGRLDVGAFETQAALASTEGDYNGDGVVNAADYTVWRDTLTQSTTPYADADGDGSAVVDTPDYNVWADNYGESLPDAATGYGSLVEAEQAVSLAAPRIGAGDIAFAVLATERGADPNRPTPPARSFLTTTTSDQLLLLLAEDGAASADSLPRETAEYQEAFSEDDEVDALPDGLPESALGGL